MCPSFSNEKKVHSRLEAHQWPEQYCCQCFISSIIILPGKKKGLAASFVRTRNTSYNFQETSRGGQRLQAFKIQDFLKTFPLCALIY